MWLAHGGSKLNEFQARISRKDPCFHKSLQLFSLPACHQVTQHSTHSRLAQCKEADRGGKSANPQKPFG